MSDYLSFHLSEGFVNEYANVEVPWGFPIGGGNHLGELVFYNAYSRIKEDGSKERWHETCARVINGMFSILKDHCTTNKTPWNEQKAQGSAKEAYDRMFNMKWLPPGRGLFAMGTEMVNGTGNSAPLQNCAAVSTRGMSPRSVEETILPFRQMMEMAMNGIGVGYDTRGADQIALHEPTEEKAFTWVVPDTREGWAESLGVQLESYLFENRGKVTFDYSEIRPFGAPLKTFGGKASGPGPLKAMHDKIDELLSGRVGEMFSSKDIVDVMNLAGKAVVAGGARRAALISFGEPDDKDFINLKNWEIYPERNGEDGWSYLSNNSVFAKVGESLDHLVENIQLNGEPGIMYMDLARQYGRLVDPPNNKDYRAALANPCVSADTWVMTVDGPLQVSELIDNPIDLVVNGKAYRSSGFWKTGTKQLYKLSFSDGRSIRVTDNHKIMTADGEWVEAGNLAIGDSVKLHDHSGFEWDEDDNEYQKVEGPVFTAELILVEEDGVEDVYDVTVDEVHAFDANGVVVHNCNEQTLEHMELCTLSECFPTHHDDIEDFKRSLKYAYLYGKAVTLLSTPWPGSNEVMQRNRRIGCSISGLAEFADIHGWTEMRTWMNEGYEEVSRRDTSYSEWLGIRESIKMTSIKPSGSVSLVAGVTPGVHWPTNDIYIRRMRLAASNPLIEVLSSAGYNVEPDYMDPEYTRVVEMPAIGRQIRTENEVTIWEKTALAVLAQRYWADNQVSFTCTFKDDEKEQIPALLRAFEGQLKGLSFLPIIEGGSYKQMPYEAIDYETYQEMASNVKPLDRNSLYGGEAAEAEGELYCTTDKCEIKIS